MGLGTRVGRLALVTLALFAGAAGVAYATQAFTQTGTATTTIFACQWNNVGTIRIVAPGVACSKYETPISWNVQGPKGDPGTPGAPGTQGTPGTPGGPGVPGADGMDGTDGISVRTAVEPAGANCQYGGVELTGASGSNYVCDGAPGPQGQPGSPGSGGDFVGSACSIPPNGTAGTVGMSVAASGAIAFTCQPDTPSLCPSPLPAVANGSASCDPATGTVTITCNAGYTLTPNSTCVNTSTDPANCGAVGTSIPANGTNHATYACIAGHPTVVSCSPGFFDANGLFSDGCELQDDPSSASGASALFLGTLNPGGSQTFNGVSDPTDDWIAFTCPGGSSCRISSTNPAFEVYTSLGSPPIGVGPGPYQTPVSALSSVRYSVRIPAGSFVTYTVTLSN